MVGGKTEVKTNAFKTLELKKNIVSEKVESEKLVGIKTKSWKLKKSWSEGLRPATLLKKRPWHRSFLQNCCEFYKIVQNIFSTEQLLCSSTDKMYYFKKMAVLSLTST